jgi:ArsR family transcriptional regulator
MLKLKKDNMNYQDELDRLSRKANVFKALGHPSRIFIIERLLEREHCVNELAEMIGVEMPTISNHLSVLRNVGLIASRKQSNNVYYYIVRDCVRDSLDCANWACE